MRVSLVLETRTRVDEAEELSADRGDDLLVRHASFGEAPMESMLTITAPALLVRPSTGSRRPSSETDEANEVGTGIRAELLEDVGLVELDRMTAQLEQGRDVVERPPKQ